ncbi:hypothetical protein SK128_008358 [Halocaridina rubra]|uniref:Uncharacterized protein n=1 Tax=Halocaridina rubra TaxID=373956 RepID=A0AAN8ZY67_HALRR
MILTGFFWYGFPRSKSRRFVSMSSELIHAFLWAFLDIDGLSDLHPDGYINGMRSNFNYHTFTRFFPAMKMRNRRQVSANFTDLALLANETKKVIRM